MAGEYLPPVVTRLTGDISDLMAKIAEAKAAMKDLNGEGTLKFDLTGNALNLLHDIADTNTYIMTQIQELGNLDGAWQRVTKDINITKDVTVTYNKAASDTGNAAAAAATGFRILGTGIRISGTALHWMISGTLEFLAVFIPAMVAAGAAALVMMQGVNNAYNHLTALYTATEATANAFHTTAGDVLGLGHALQTAQNQANPGVYELLGAALDGVRHNFLGLDQAGLQVTHTLDQFAAKLDLELKGAMGSQVSGLLSNMVQDLTELGQILGNVGHALLNLASAMPGLADMLLKIADAVSRVILWITQLNPLIITIVMGFEEFYRWGGLIATVIGLIARAMVMIPIGAWNGFLAAMRSAGAIMAGVFDWASLLVGGLGTLFTTIGRLLPVVGKLGTGIQEVGVFMAQMAVDTKLMQGMGVGLAIFATLAILLSHVKDEAQQVAANVVKAAQAAQGLQVFAVAAIGMDKLTMAMIQVNTQMSQISPGFQQAGTTIAAFQTQRIDTLTIGLSRAIGMVGGFGQALANFGKGQVGGGILVTIGNFLHSLGGATQAAGDISTLTSAENQLLGITGTVANNLHFLGGQFHTTAVGAAYLAQAAGVNLQVPLIKGSEAAKMATQQIQNLERGFGAMSAPMGILGNDMTALGIQTQLADTKVSQLNSAWDQWISSVTSTANDMAEAETAMSQMGKTTSSASASISGAISSVSAGVPGVTYSLKGMGQTAMQSWQQFSSAINTGNSALDQLRIGMAEGVVSGSQFTNITKALVGQMLQFTGGNKTAVMMLSQLAHEAGGPTTSSLKTLANWAGITGKAARDQFVQGMLAATDAMGNMSKVAGNLSAALNGQIDQALAGAIMQFSGLNGAIKTYVQDLGNTTTPQSKLNTDLNNIAQALLKEQGMQSAASKGWQAATGIANGYTKQLQSMSQWLQSLHSKDIYVRVHMTQIGGTSLGDTIGHITNGYASGTSDASPGYHWVGENGPELEYFRGGEQVVPHGQSMSMTGGMSEGQTIEIPVTVTLDGQVLYKAVETRVYSKNMQNGVKNPRGGAQGRFGVR